MKPVLHYSIKFPEVGNMVRWAECGPPSLIPQPVLGYSQWKFSQCCCFQTLWCNYTDSSLSYLGCCQEHVCSYTGIPSKQYTIILGRL